MECNSQSPFQIGNDSQHEMMQEEDYEVFETNYNCGNDFNESPVKGKANNSLPSESDLQSELMNNAVGIKILYI